VNRIGSRLVTELGALLSTHWSCAGDEQSSSETLKVWVLDSKKTLPVAWLIPIDGSPASVPRPFGAA